MGTTDAAVQLTRAIRTPRLIDLALRAEAGHLTKAEELALRILEGQADAIMAAVDAAQEEYANGTYRVPVKVVADWNKTLLVYTHHSEVDPDITDIATGGLERLRARLVAEEAQVLVLNAGAKLEVYESAAPGVEVKAADAA